MLGKIIYKNKSNQFAIPYEDKNVFALYDSKFKYIDDIIYPAAIPFLEIGGLFRYESENNKYIITDIIYYKMNIYQIKTNLFVDGILHGNVIFQSNKLEDWGTIIGRFVKIEPKPQKLNKMMFYRNGILVYIMDVDKLIASGYVITDLNRKTKTGAENCFIFLKCDYSSIFKGFLSYQNGKI